jgi:hypothetical protein
MNRIVLAVAISTACASAFASDERAATATVKKYSEAIACNIPEARDVKNQYKTVTLVPGDKELGGLGAIYVVHWIGDVGCAGGNATVFSNFSVAEQRGFASIPPVVVPEYKFPDLDLVQLTGLSAKDGLLLIQGLSYGPNDQQHRPQKKVSYTLKLDVEKGMFIKR